jgi:DNA-binding transcriptional ArsR family regulator
MLFAPIWHCCGLDGVRRAVYLVFMRNSEAGRRRGTALRRAPEPVPGVDLRVLKALASVPRLAVLEWLKDPVANFPPQTDGDLLVDGVCADFIRGKLGMAAATASRHLTLMTEARLLTATRKKGWTFYRRDEAAIREFTEALHTDL